MLLEAIVSTVGLIVYIIFGHIVGCKDLATTLFFPLEITIAWLYLHEAKFRIKLEMDKAYKIKAKDLTLIYILSIVWIVKHSIGVVRRGDSIGFIILDIVYTIIVAVIILKRQNKVKKSEMADNLD